jgi:hypothetical protein
MYPLTASDASGEVGFLSRIGSQVAIRVVEGNEGFHIAV